MNSVGFQIPASRWQLTLCWLVLLGPLLFGQSTLAVEGGASISPGSLLARVLSGGAREVIVDVRTRAEFKAGHLPGAINVPYRELARRHGELLDHKDRGMVLYSERGKLATRAENLLRELGFRNLMQLEGHMSTWRAAGYPTER